MISRFGQRPSRSGKLARVVPCAICGAKNAEGQRFCGSCAAPLRPSVDGHRQRKTVTIVFCDVVGSTALSESRDPEAVERLLARYFARMRAIVESHGGTVEKFIGDAVVAVFGVPVSHEDDALRALRAAVEMQQALPGLGIEARIGVNTGEIVTSGHGTIVTGDAVNVAARLEQASAAGEVLVGLQTVALAGEGARVEELEPLRLKGKSDPVAAFRLVEVGLGTVRRRGDRFVARTEELALLREVWERVLAERRCELFTIVGEPGIGKSRLVEELIDGLEARVVRGRCLSYGEGITYFPVVEVIKELGALPEDAAAAEVLRSLLRESEVATSADEIAWAFRKLLEDTSPLLVMFDDIQWGVETFLDLVEHVALFSTGAPLMLLCIARPELNEQRPRWLVNLQLGPLPPDDVETLLPATVSGSLRARIIRAAGGNPLFLTEMIAVAADAEGEVVVPPTLKALLAARLDQLEREERGVLQRGSIEGELFHRGAVEALSPAGAELTPRFTALVRKELIRPANSMFPTDAGFSFCHLLIRDAAYDALPKATRAELHERFADWLDQHGAELVEQDEIVGYHLEQAYRYQTELGPLDPTDEALAARAAARLISAGRGARDRTDAVATVSLFRRAADLHPPSRPALLVQIAEVLYWLGDYAQSIELCDEVTETARAHGDRAAVTLAILQRTIVTGHAGDVSVSFESVAALANEAAELLERVGNDGQVAKALYEGAAYREWLGRGSEAAELHQLALLRSQRAGDVFRVRSCLEGMLASKALGATTVGEFFAYLNAMPDELRLVISGWSRTHYFIALMAAYAGNVSRAEDEYEEARRLQEDIGKGDDPRWQAQLEIVHGMFELVAGNFSVAEKALRVAYDRFGEIGAQPNRSTAATILADVLSRQYRDDEAIELLDVADKIAPIDDYDPQVRSRFVRARILCRRGQLAEADRLSREALETIAATDQIVLHAETLLSRAEVLRALGSHTESEAALREALKLFEQKENVVQAEQTRALLLTAGASEQPGLANPKL